MIGFRDFAPKLNKKPGIWRAGDLDSFESAVAAAGAWIEKSGVRVIQIETVVLPNIHLEDGTTDVELLNREPVRTYQFVRIWFEMPKGAAYPYRD